MKKELFVALLLLIGCRLHAQIQYTRTSFKSAYSPVSASATKLVPGVKTDQLSGSNGVSNGDDGTAYISLPFDFNYAGVAYTTANYLGICTNGFIYPSISNTITSKVTLFSGNLSSSVSSVKNTPIIAPYWSDMEANSSISGFTGSIAYETTGVTGSRVLTIEWSNYPSARSFTQRSLNFEVKIYEGSNVIEFLYGPVGLNGSVAFNTSEFAAVGIKNALGGINNYIDAITGSSVISSSDLNSLQFPQYNFRFTPGAPMPITGGTYNVGVGQFYFNLSEAIADMNHRGISGPVNLILIDAVYDTSTTYGSNIFPLVIAPVNGINAVNKIAIQPLSGKSIIRYRGNPGNGYINSGDIQPMISALHTNEPIVALYGADWVTLDNLRLEQYSNVSGNVVTVKRGLLVLNSSANDGSQNNTFKNIDIHLDRTDKNSLGIEQTTVYSIPASSAGTNSSNHYYNFNISNAYAGVFLNGSNANPDNLCEVGTINDGISVIGGVSSNDIGNGNSQSWGIRSLNQANLKIYNTEIRNITVNGNVAVDGIYMDMFTGTNEIFNNKIHDISNQNATSTSIITGIRVNHYTTGINIVHIYNNFISRLSSSYSGAASNVIQLKGIFASGTGGSTAQEYDIDFNNVLINGSGSPNISNTCMQVASSTGAKINARNNIFFNNSGAQTGAKHYAVVISGSALGNTGSIWDYNDYLITNSANGYIGSDLFTDKIALNDWQNAYGQDQHSLSVNPGFNDDYNLHTTSTFLNNSGNSSGISWLTSDIDGDKRCPLAGCPGNSNAPDIGADEFNVPTEIVLPVKLEMFRGYKSGPYNIISWIASLEENKPNYIIERSIDGLAFNVIGAVAAYLNNNGSNHYYSFQDSNILNRKYYYRLKIIEQNYHFSYSPVIQIREQEYYKILTAFAYPNPVSEHAKLVIESQIQGFVFIDLYSMNGNKIISCEKFVQKGNNIIDIDTKRLTAGTYMFAIRATDRRDVVPLRLIKF